MKLTNMTKRLLENKKSDFIGLDCGKLNSDKYVVAVGTLNFAT